MTQWRGELEATANFRQAVLASLNEIQHTGEDRLSLDEPIGYRKLFLV